MFANNLNNTFAFQFKILTDKAFSFLYFTSSFLWNIDRKKMILKNCIEQNAREDCKKQRKFINAKMLWVKVFDMTCSCKSKNMKIRLIISSGQSQLFEHFRQAERFFSSFTENAREVAIDLAEPYPNSFFPSLNFWI